MVLLERAYPYTPMFRDAVKGTISEHQGKTMEWRIYGGAAVGTTGAGLALATTALTEGQPPLASTLTVAKVPATVGQYGAYAALTDLLVHQGIDPIWTETYELLGEQAGQTLHTLLINDLVLGTNVEEDDYLLVA
jgi:N4-gp56 family major capsid protein